MLTASRPPSNLVPEVESKQQRRNGTDGVNRAARGTDEVSAGNPRGAGEAERRRQSIGGRPRLARPEPPESARGASGDDHP
jgi:hypothetical protein